jgi:hypothetical protein
MGNALNLAELDQEQALNLAKFYISTNNNCFFFGRRGVGKTQIALRAAKECGFKVNYINLSVIERADLLGYPNMTAEGDIITYKSPEFLPRLVDNAKPDSILVFDEVDKCYPEIWAPLLEILQFRTINGKPINAASCILTGNLIEEGAYSNQISTAILDRGAKYILSFNFEKWVEWARIHQVHDLIIGFLVKYPDLACGKIEDTCASPSPRGWTMASEAIIQARPLKIVDIETTTQIIAGFVGHEAAIKFKVWYEHFRKFDVLVASIIEAGRITFDYASLAETEKIVFVIAACHHAKMKTLEEKKSKLIYLENLCRFFEGHTVDPEIKMLALNNAFTFDMIAEKKWYACKSFFDLFSKMNESFGIR